MEYNLCQRKFENLLPTSYFTTSTNSKQWLVTTTTTTIAESERRKCNATTRLQHQPTANCCRCICYHQLNATQCPSNGKRHPHENTRQRKERLEGELGRQPNCQLQNEKEKKTPTKQSKMQRKTKTHRHNIAAIELDLLFPPNGQHIQRYISTNTDALTSMQKQQAYNPPPTFRDIQPQFLPIVAEIFSGRR